MKDILDAGEHPKPLERNRLGTNCSAVDCEERSETGVTMENGHWHHDMVGP